MDLEALRKVIRDTWGFTSLRPLQEQAMRADLRGRDSVVVLPTGGGKSLCYQAPAVLRGEGHTTVVVSPLISLMKDQVDGLQACGVPAVQLDSSQSPAEQNAYRMDLIQGAVRLLFVSPERLVLPGFQRLLHQLRVRTFAIDEAHCISHWGHDFRPEYRQLSQLKSVFPKASVHAYTATATERVRRDIAEQLGLRDPEVLVGDFDRPNLAYRVVARRSLKRQVLDVIARHPDEAGIIYCLRRRDVDELGDELRAGGLNVVAYHAGMTPDERRAAQDAFAGEACNLVVATVAFGMGIDRSNIRFVLHAAMPKSVEHYQQETGRAGRDGLEAECVLLYSGSDVITWKSVLEKSAAEPGVDPSFLPSALQHLNDMDRYARGAVCRHRALVEYFGQAYPAASCGACDLCLGDTAEVPGAQVVAQKILSCVARVQERFGINHVIGVLRGEESDAVRRRGHDRLTTFGLLKEHAKADVRDWVYQLLGQKVLVQQGDEYPVLRLNAASWEVMRGQRTVRLLQPVRRARGEKPERAKPDAASWEGVDAGLFEVLRGERRRLAEARGVPPYVIFSDASLRDLARIRPSSPERMRLVYGVGDAKLRDLGPHFLPLTATYCREHGLAQDQPAAGPVRAAPPADGPRRSRDRDVAYGLFRQGLTVADVTGRTGWSRTKALGHLADYVRDERPASIATWVEDTLYQRIATAARQVGTARLKPIYLLLGEQVSYDAIRLVVSHLEGQAGH